MVMSGRAVRAAAAAKLRTMRDCAIGCLLRRYGNGRRISAIACAGGRPEEKLLAILKGNFAGMTPVAAVPSVPASDGNLVALLQGDVFFPSSPIQHVGRKAFELPVADLAGCVFDIEVEEAMRIRPFDFGYNTGQSDRLIRVVLRTEGVMRGSAHASRERQGDYKRQGLDHMRRIKLASRAVNAMFNLLNAS